MTAPPCAGKWDLFDSTRYADHQLARRFCAACPMVAECHRRLQAARRDAYGYVPRGTWAGRLYGYHASTHKETA